MGRRSATQWFSAAPGVPRSAKTGSANPSMSQPPHALPPDVFLHMSIRSGLENHMKIPLTLDWLVEHLPLRLVSRGFEVPAVIRAVASTFRTPQGPRSHDGPFLPSHPDQPTDLTGTCRNS